jgi:epoxyqueuosine reductase QueG
MQNFEHHPSVRAARAQPTPHVATKVSAELLKRLALQAGADDAGAVALSHRDLVDERDPVLNAFPKAKSLIALVVRMHPENVRSPARSIANQEFHHVGLHVDEVARRLVGLLTEHGHQAMNPAMAFPMEMQNFPGRTWVVSHKTVAVAAQLGRIGLHRNVIHPKFGSFIVLGTVITSAELEGHPEPLTYNPCVDCKLCVAACPVGAIEPTGGFRFSACYDHNYREFMTGFGDLLEEVAESKNRHDLRERVSISELASMWQSLTYRANYKAAHCIAVCPAGDDVIGPFVRQRGTFLKEVLKPLTERIETVYVVEGSDAQSHVVQRFPHKQVRVFRSSLRAADIPGFFRALPLVFQRGPAKGLHATFHFSLATAGGPPHLATVRIEDGALTVESGLVGSPHVSVSGDGPTWLDVVSGKRSPVAAVLRRKLKLRGDRKLLNRFAKCFPRWIQG